MTIIKKFGFTLALVFTGQSFAQQAKPSCPAPWRCEEIDVSLSIEKIEMELLPTFPTPTFFPNFESKDVRAKIRAGYLPESGDFKGNIIYFEGLGDSMLNHRILFEKLTQKGFRVIAFDYMGQGGSGGSMNNTRIEDVEKIGHLAWDKFAKNLKENPYPEKIVMGWSAGGLAAYYSATHEGAKKMILLAPAIAPRMIVGEQRWWEFEFNHITLKSLTTGYKNPEIKDRHVDPIRPSSALQVPQFALSLLLTADESKDWTSEDSVRGLVLLSGDHDTYVDAEKTKKILGGKFKVIQYAGALHEIDNETLGISNRVHEDILRFLAQ